MQIKRIQIQGFKSLENVIFEPETGFSCLVGSNGAGKSNFCDALLFFKSVICDGVKSALDRFGDTSLILSSNVRQIITFNLDLKISDNLFQYHLQVDLGSQKIINESFGTEKFKLFKRNKEDSKRLSLKKLDDLFLKMDEKIKEFKNYDSMRENQKSRINKDDLMKDAIEFHNTFSILKDDIPEICRDSKDNLSLDKTGLSSYCEDLEFFDFISNLNIYRINPLSPKIPSKLFNTSHLLMYGENLTTILSELKKDEEKWQTLHDWLSLIVPSISEVQVHQGEFDSALNLRFIENGKPLPAISISDGTIYTLSILAAVLWNQDQQTLLVIEEPERGVHPQALIELVNFMREATEENLNIIVTTHSETLVRSCKLEELWLVDKAQGQTILKSAKQENPNLKETSLDQAWLMNLFNGGLPW